MPGFGGFSRGAQLMKALFGKKNDEERTETGVDPPDQSPLQRNAEGELSSQYFCFRWDIKSVL